MMKNGVWIFAKILLICRQIANDFILLSQGKTPPLSFLTIINNVTP